MTGDEMALIVGVGGVFQLAGAVIAWLAARSRERTRARTLVTLLRLAGPGATLTDRRTESESLTVRTGRTARTGAGVE